MRYYTVRARYPLGGYPLKVLRSLRDEDRRVFEAVNYDGASTDAEVVILTGIGLLEVRNSLNRLVEEGLLGREDGP